MGVQCMAKLPAMCIFDRMHKLIFASFAILSGAVTVAESQTWDSTAVDTVGLHFNALSTARGDRSVGGAHRPSHTPEARYAVRAGRPLCAVEERSVSRIRAAHV